MSNFRSNIPMKEFSNSTEALDFLRTYGIEARPSGNKAQFLTSIRLALFENEFNTYLVSELHASVENDRIVDYANYLNSEVVLKFCKYRAELAKSENEKYENEKLTIIEYIQSGNVLAKIITDQGGRLEMLFDSVSKYKAIMEILVSEKLVHADTYIWKDDKKGNKSYLAALIKDLHSKKYYKKNTKPTNEQIVLICKNTFGWEVRIDTIKKAKPSGFDFNFIPLASTIS